MEKLDDYTFTISTGKNGDTNRARLVATVPVPADGQAGMMASPTWLAAVDGDREPGHAAGRHRTVHRAGVPARRPHDGRRRTPTTGARTTPGNQLPYLDEIEFRVIVDSQVRQQALESGDVDLIATADPTVVGPLSENDDFVTLLQNVLSETAYVDVAPHQAAVPEPRGSLRARPGDRPGGLDQHGVSPGTHNRPNGPFTPGQDGYLEDTGLPEYDPDAARAAIEAWEAENGPLTINYSTTPTGTNKAAADYLQQKWGEVGVDVTQNVIEQSVLITNALSRDARVRGVRLAQPRRHLRRHPELLVERLRLRRLRRGDGRTVRRR